MTTRTEIAGSVSHTLWLDTFIEWITTVDHKKIGLMYLLASLGFFLVGGIEALMIRIRE